MRIRCWLLGCSEKRNDYFCRRCDTYYGDDEWVFHEDAKLSFIRRWAWNIETFLRPGWCRECDNRLYGFRMKRSGFCSQQCLDKHIPF